MSDVGGSFSNQTNAEKPGDNPPEQEQPTRNMGGLDEENKDDGKCRRHSSSCRRILESAHIPVLIIRIFRRGS